VCSKDKFKSFPFYYDKTVLIHTFKLNLYTLKLQSVTCSHSLARYVVTSFDVSIQCFKEHTLKIGGFVLTKFIV